MEIQNIAASGGFSAVVILVTAAVYKLMRHFRCYSTCCGRELVGRVDLSPTSSDGDFYESQV